MEWEEGDDHRLSGKMPTSVLQTGALTPYLLDTFMTLGHLIS